MKALGGSFASLSQYTKYRHQNLDNSMPRARRQEQRRFDNVDRNAVPEDPQNHANGAQFLEVTSQQRHVGKTAHGNLTS